MVDFKIISITPGDKNKTFNVTIETAYGIKKFVFNESDKFLHLDTDKPKFLHKIKEAVEKKYEDRETKSVVDKDWDVYIGTSYDSTLLEDISVKAMAEKVIKRRDELKKIRSESDNQI